MPKFAAVVKITEPIYGVTLNGPLAVGDTISVSEDEAAILRGLPEQFVELTWEPERRTWTGTSPLNKMADPPEITKSEDAGGVTGCADGVQVNEDDADPAAAQ